MSEAQYKLSIRSYGLVQAMDGMPGCFLRPHRLPGGARGFRLLSVDIKPYGSYSYAVVERCVHAGYIEPVKDGDKFYIYMRTEKMLPGKGEIVL